MVLLGLNELNNLCHIIYDNLSKCGVTEKSTLTILVDKKSLKKIDEDLFYRQNNQDKEFIPSENEVNVIFNNVTIKIKATEN